MSANFKGNLNELNSEKKQEFLNVWQKNYNLQSLVP